MADRRDLRASNHTNRTAITFPQSGRAPRNRATRSASRDVDDANVAARPNRRSARQASVASESESEGPSTRNAKKRAQKQTVVDLTTVEEMDTQIAIDDAPGTPPRNLTDSIPHSSPGGVSEMSGTTAITSFSMVEAETLEAKFIIRHLPKLYSAVEEFLHHLTPDHGRLEDDESNMQAIKRPDSEFNQDYRYFAGEVEHNLKYFRGERHQYIHLRAVHRALLGPNQDTILSQSGLDLVLYLTNLLIFAQQTINSDRSENNMSDILRNLDGNSFPSLFLSALVPTSDTANLVSGESRLLEETYGVALDLRTQLFILMLQQAADKGNDNPGAILHELFCLPEASQSHANTSAIRGWATPGLETLKPTSRDRVVDRMNKIKEFFTTDVQSLENDDAWDFEGLEHYFPWEGTILRILDWVRLRTREIRTVIQEQGGIATIIGTVETEIQQALARQSRTITASQGTHRRKRVSFGRDRRRSSLRFDPNAELDFGEIDALRVREKAVQQPHEVSLSHVQEPHEEAQQPEEHIEEDVVKQAVEQEEFQPIPGSDIEVDRHQDQQQAEASANASGPPRTAAELERLMGKLTEASKTQNKENLRGGFFARQPNAERVEFGDGFDEPQPTPGSLRLPHPIRKNRTEVTALVSPRKRRRIAESVTSDDDETFESIAPSSNAHRRREQAPVAKKIRIDPTSSAAPPSHQPPPSNRRAPDIQEESLSEHDAPEMSEEVPSLLPPPSSFTRVKTLAKISPVLRQRKYPTRWSEQEEAALEKYMGLFGPRYSQILSHDKSDAGFGLLQDRTQVNIKDKARNMAITMIKSNTPLSEGFEGIITATSAQGRRLIEDGYEL